MNVPTQPPPPAKKGMGALAWVGIGCGVIIVICFIALGGAAYLFKKKVVDPYKENPGMAAAELIVRANPDLELVSSDPKTNTLTVKDKKTGETVTINAEDIKNGKLKVTTDKGTTSYDASGGKDGGVTIKTTDEKGQEQVSTLGGTSAQDLPSWVPTYPGGTVQGTFDNKGPEGRSAAFAMTTPDTTDKVIDWYEAQLKAAGFKVEKNTYNANGVTGGSVSGKSDDGKREVNVMIAAAEGKTQATVMFGDKK